MIISCGEALIDLIKDTKSEDYTPLVGGSLLNVSIALKKSGVKSAIMTNISHDDFGKKIMNYLINHQVSTDYISRSYHKSGLMLIQRDDNGDAIYQYYGENTAEKNFQVLAKPFVIDDEVNCMHFGSFSLICGATSKSFTTILEQEHQNRIMSVDMNLRLMIEPDLNKWRRKFDKIIPRVHILKASGEDIKQLYNIPTLNKQECYKILAKWNELGVPISIITNAENGVFIMYKDQILDFINPLNNNIVDTVGAGDCFIANFLASLYDKRVLTVNQINDIPISIIENSVTQAIEAANYTITQKGAVFPTKDLL